MAVEWLIRQLQSVIECVFDCVFICVYVFVSVGTYVHGLLLGGKRLLVCVWGRNKNVRTLIQADVLSCYESLVWHVVRPQFSPSSFGVHHCSILYLWVCVGAQAAVLRDVCL